MSLEYCNVCDEPMKPMSPLPDGSPRWYCDNCGVWVDEPPTENPPTERPTK